MPTEQPLVGERLGGFHAACHVAVTRRQASDVHLHAARDGRPHLILVKDYALDRVMLTSPAQAFAGPAPSIRPMSRPRRQPSRPVEPPQIMQKGSFDIVRYFLL